MIKQKIPRQVIILGMVSFFTDFASEMFYPVAPIFLTAALGSSMAIVGLIEGIAEVTAGILKGYFGLLSDKIGKRALFVRIGYGLSALVKSLPGFLPFISVVGAARTLDRVGKGVRTSPRDALLAANSNGNTGAIFGLHRSMDTFEAVVGRLIAVLLLYVYPGNYTLIFIVALLPSLFAVYFTWLVKDKNVKRNSQKKLYKEFWDSAPTEYKKMLWLITAFSLVNSSDVFLILKSKEISQSDLTAILGYVFYNFIYAVVSYPAGILSDKFGKKNIFIVGLLVFSLVYLGFAQDLSLHFIWILFALYGIYSAATEGIAKAWVSDIIDDRYKATGIGLLNTCMSMAILLGSFFTGVLWDQFGPALPFHLSSGISLVVATLLFVWKHEN